MVVSWFTEEERTILSSTNVFNIDNDQKCFLSIKLIASAYYLDFWRIMWHWKLE